MPPATPYLVLTHSDRWWLDQLVAWEDQRIESAATASGPAARAALADRLPP